MSEPIIFDRAVLRNKIMGCWLGKNAGGTLGEPLEEKFGRDEMFNIDWYPELPEGGIPNDDLELQLIWLQALQEKGPGLTAFDLAQYWLDCIAYNFDEYGLSKVNLQKGLLPPVSGWFNNAFRDCMGSPIRSEIWACVAPGHPDVAAHYAFQDAICDHGGGESVYGEIFNAVVQSAAFLESDKRRLIELGLGAIPKDCFTSRAIAEAVRLHSEGVDWISCRNRLKEMFYNPVAQYSPLNLGFQTIGWLYGEDFGDAICKAVNCGWDTDCTAATLGATLGIIMGADALPKKWIEPLGMEISTNMKTGGIRHLTAPTDISELTQAVMEQAERVLRYWNRDVRFSDIGACKGSLVVPDMEWMKTYRPDTIRTEMGGVTAFLTYKDHAAIIGGTESHFSVKLHNPHPEPLDVRIAFTPPANWKCDSVSRKALIKPLDDAVFDYSVSATAETINETNRGDIHIEIKGRPALPTLPVVFVGGSHWLVSPFFPGKKLEQPCGVDEECIFTTPLHGWNEFWRTGNDLEISDFLPDDGVVYLLHHLWSSENQDVVVGVPNNSRMEIRQDGNLLHKTKEVVPLRPNLGNGGAFGDLSNYKITALKKGWNQFLIKLERYGKSMDTHFTIGTIHPSCIKNHGGPLLNVNRSLFIWNQDSW